MVKGSWRRQVGTINAVDDVSLTLRAGETLALVGESGCGKTTVGRCILRLVEPDAGQLFFRGTDLRTLGAEPLRQMRRHMQIVFQDPFSSLNPRHTVGDIIATPLVVHGLLSERDAKERSRQLLLAVGLQAADVSRYPHEFSGGQRQRIGIARAIALQPDLVVCDEAVSALDVSVKAQIINLLLDLKDELGLSYLFITHDLATAWHIASHVMVMYLGRVVEYGSREDIFERPFHPYTQALLAAVPRADPHRRRARMILTGEPPSPLQPPPGCHFHTRCPEVEERCRKEVPKLVRIGEGRKVRCHLHGGVAA